MFLRVCKDQSPSDIVQYTHPSFGLSLPPAVYPLYRLSEKKKNEIQYNTNKTKKLCNGDKKDIYSLASFSANASAMFSKQIDCKQILIVFVFDKRHNGAVEMLKISQLGKKLINLVGHLIIAVNY